MTAAPSSSATPTAPPEARATVEVDSLVKVSFLLRLLTLLASMLGFVNQQLTPLSAAAVMFLALTSMAGLALLDAPRVLRVHPSLVAVDAVVMTALMVALGTDNPLVLAPVSTCVVIGVTLPRAAAALGAAMMVLGYLTALYSGPHEQGSFLTGVSLPVTFVSLVVLGQVFRRVAEQKRESEQALADLITGAAAAAERSRLARELHDSTAKTLQGMALTARALPLWIDRDPDRASCEAAEVAEAADAAITRLRELFSTLRQDDLDQPFHESLAALVRTCAERHRLRVSADLQPVALSAPDVRYELLAAAREALTNAATHSGCDRVSVRLRQHGDEVVVEVADDGAGFDPAVLAESEREGHFGVRGYHERLEVVGGRAVVDTAPGRGTTITLEAPRRGLREADAS